MNTLLEIFKSHEDELNFDWSNKFFLARAAREGFCLKFINTHIHCADLNLEDATLLKNVLTLLTSLD